MKKFSILVILIALIAASFALPAFAEETCDANVDYLELGHAQLDAEDFEAALHSANCGLRFAPESYALYMLRADIYCDTGMFEESIADYSHAIEIRPDSAEAYNYRGWGHYQHGELAAAMNDFNHSIALDPELAYAYNNRGLVWQTWGERELALADYEMAIGLGLVQPWAEINLYNLHFEMAKLANS